MNRLLTAIAVMALVLAPTVMAQVTINEASTGTPDFIELYNCSAAPVDISGWTLSTWYATAAGAPIAETPFVFPAGTIIPGYQYLLTEENGVAGTPGNLPNSISVGFNYFWVANRTLEIALTDAGGMGVDYVYRDVFANGTAPNLPAGTNWTGTLTSGVGDNVSRNSDIDTDDSADWTISTLPNTNFAANAGQLGCGPQPPQPATPYQVNSTAASMDIDNVQSDGQSAAITQVGLGASSTLTLMSGLTTPPFELVITPTPLMPSLIITPAQQTVNVDLGTAFYLNGGAGPVFAPLGAPLVIGLSSPAPLLASAQAVLVNPAALDFFSLTQGVQFEAIACPNGSNFDSLALGTTLPVGWINGSTGNMNWTVNAAGTTSTATGPTAAFSGSNYIYCETSGAGSTGTFSFDTCPIDTSSLATNTIDFQLSRIGVAIATLEIQVDDGNTGTFVTIPGGTFTGPDLGQAQGAVEWTAVSLPLPAIANPSFTVRALYSGTTTFTGDIALDDFGVN